METLVNEEALLLAGYLRNEGVFWGISNPREGDGLVEVSAFFPLLRLLVEPEHFVDDFHVRQQHPPATVPLNPQAIEDVAGVLSRADASCEFFPSVAHEFATRETPNRNNQSVIRLPVALLLFGSCAWTAELLWLLAS